MPIYDLSRLKVQIGITGVAKGRLAMSLQTPRSLRDAHEKPLLGLFEDGSEPPPPIITAPAATNVAPKLAGPPLERAATLLASGHIVAGIDAMLEAWRTHRSPELADLIDRASTCIPGGDRPLFLTRATNRTKPHQRAWLNALAEPGGVPRALRNLTYGGSLEARIAALRKLPADPRIARRLIELGIANLFGKRTALGVIGHTGDVRDFEALRTLTNIPYFARAVHERMVAAIAAIRPTELELAPLVAAIETAERPLRVELALVDAIAAAPAEDAPRLVYADWLMEQVHPRGEYIALAVKRARTRAFPVAHEQRLRQLAEVPYLFGALDELAVSQVRERDRGIDRELLAGGSVEALTWRAAAAMPLARAVSALKLLGRPASVEPIAAFVRATRVATIDGLSQADAAALTNLLGAEFRVRRGRVQRSR